MNTEKIIITSIINDGHGASEFGTKEIELEGDSMRRLSKQQSATNFRLRTSDTAYSSDWHVAGDPTLLVILKGAVEIELRNGSTKIFQTGDIFIAEDFLLNKNKFCEIHGHRAKVIGSQNLSALHLKLEK